MLIRFARQPNLIFLKFKIISNEPQLQIYVIELRRIRGLKIQVEDEFSNNSFKEIPQNTTKNKFCRSMKIIPRMTF